MNTNLVTNLRGGRFGRGLDASTRALLAAGASLGYALPSDACRKLIDETIVWKKDEGLWSIEDVFYGFAQDGDSDFATLNWIDPSKHQATKVNSPLWSPTLGMGGDLVSAYIETGFNPPSHNGNHQIDNAARFLWVSKEMVSPGNTLDGTSRMDNFNILTNLISTAHRVNATNGASISADLTGTGYMSIHRTSNNDIAVFKGNFAYNATQAVNAPVYNDTNWTIQLFRRSTGVMGNACISLYGAGAAFVAKNGIMKQILDSYMAKISAL